MKNLLALALLTLGLPAFAASGDDTFDRALTRPELQRLLPRYVAMVERQAASLPSATERQNFRALAYSITNPTYYAFDQGNRIIGRQSRSAEDLAKEVERSLGELRAVTPEQRQKEAADLVAGFKGAANAGKLSCVLGYEKGETKDASARIVKCEDNRSEKGRGGDDEGYYDVRIIILSIDATTLEPVSTLSLDHPIAG